MPEPVTTTATPDQFRKNCETLNRGISKFVEGHIRDLMFKVTQAKTMISAAQTSQDNVAEVVAEQLLQGAKMQCADIVAGIDSSLAALKVIRNAPPAKQE